MGKRLLDIGDYSELGLSNNCGSILDYTQKKANYEKEKVIRYLKTRGKRIASCSHPGIDCVSGEKLSHNLEFFSDGEYCWNNVLSHHVDRYNVALPEHFVKKVNNEQ